MPDLRHIWYAGWYRFFFNLISYFNWLSTNNKLIKILGSFRFIKIPKSIFQKNLYHLVYQKWSKNEPICISFFLKIMHKFTPFNIDIQLWNAYYYIKNHIRNTFSHFWLSVIRCTKSTRYTRWFKYCCSPRVWNPERY